MEVFQIQPKIAATGFLGGSLSSFFVPIVPFLIMATVLVVVNLISGIIASVKKDERVEIDFFGERLLYFCLYFTAILLAHGMSVVFGPFSFFTHAVALTICGAEFKRFGDYFNIITGIKMWSKVSGFLKGRNKN